jgi:hypothetical protein
VSQTLSEAQRATLRALADALSRAGRTGVLDYLMGFIANPDSINDVCDAVDVALNK